MSITKEYTWLLALLPCYAQVCGAESNTLNGEAIFKTLKRRHDPVEERTWYSPKNAESRNLYLLICEETNRAPMLYLTLRTSGRYLMVQSFTVKGDGCRFDVDAMRAHRSHDSAYRNWVEQITVNAWDYSNCLAKISTPIADTQKFGVCYLRATGFQDHRTIELTTSELEDVRRMLTAYWWRKEQWFRPRQ